MNTTTIQSGTPIKRIADGATGVVVGTDEGMASASTGTDPRVLIDWTDPMIAGTASGRSWERVADVERAACEHDTRSALRREGDEISTLWECDACGEITPMTDEEIDWTRTDVEKCVRCGHSEAFGPLGYFQSMFGGQRRIHHNGCG